MYTHDKMCRQKLIFIYVFSPPLYTYVGLNVQFQTNTCINIINIIARQGCRLALKSEQGSLI